jgi:hypothetical protein
MAEIEPDSDTLSEDGSADLFGCADYDSPPDSDAEDVAIGDRFLDDFCHSLIRMKTTEESYSMLLKTNLMHFLNERLHEERGIRLPKSIKTFYRRMFKQHADLLEIKDIRGAFESNEGVSYVSLSECLSLWLSIPSISRQVHAVNDQYTLPFIDCGCENMPRFGTHGPMWTGVRFYQTVKDYAPLWRRKFEEARRCGTKTLFVHITHFTDGFSALKSRSKGFFIMQASLGEFAHHQRSSPIKKTVLPVCLVDIQAAKCDVIEDVLFKKLTSDYEALMQGVHIYDSLSKKMVLVVAIPYLIIGDALARAKSGGLNKLGPTTTHRNSWPEASQPQHDCSLSPMLHPHQRNEDANIRSRWLCSSTGTH